jgi:hypothetical protein
MRSTLVFDETINVDLYPSVFEEMHIPKRFYLIALRIVPAIAQLVARRASCAAFSAAKAARH